jgi:hypothetical protein
MALKEKEFRDINPRNRTLRVYFKRCLLCTPYEEEFSFSFLIIMF